MSDNTTPQPDAAKLRECPIENAKYGALAALYRDCPNRAPSPVESELREALRWLHDWCDDNVTDPAVTIPLHKARAALANGGGK